ncbi:MAG: FAD-dependent oxidoreductase [Chloroflexota bacterium]|nr:MAG: FAD-dependent oxidoreductase [Chloroflexota bacterium]
MTLYGTLWCSDCKRAKRFLAEQRVPYTYVDVDKDPEGLRLVQRVNAGKNIIPTIVFGDGSTLVEPTNAEFAEKLGLLTSGQRRFYDLIIVGSGPAGLTAALYAAREGIDTLVIESGGIGGQAGVTERLDNFPGFPEGIGGAEFADRLRQQAERFGVEILSAQRVVGVDADGRYRDVRTADGEHYRAWAVLLALGSTYRRLEIPGEKDFIGAGVHFCATCDGPFYRDREVLVIGGGNSAAEEGLFLTKFASKVTIATRGLGLRASRVVAEKVVAHPRIRVMTEVTPEAFTGKSYLESVILRHTQSHETTELRPAGVFVFIGLTPNTQMLGGVVQLDERGFIVTDGTLQTSVPGIFAAGDVRAGSTKQAASAAGEGATAALAIRGYVEPLAGGKSRIESAEAVL